MTTVALTRSHARRQILERMVHAADRYLRLADIEPEPAEILQLAARWTEELIAAHRSAAPALPELPRIRQYEDPEIRAAMGDLYGSISRVLDELYAAVVADIGPQLSLAGGDAETLELAGWEPDAHPRWPHGTPGTDKGGHPLGGEFMQIADLLKKLKTSISKTEDVSFIAHGATSVKRVTATVNADGNRVDFHVQNGADGKAHVVTTDAGVDTGVLVETLRKLDAGEAINRPSAPPANPKPGSATAPPAPAAPGAPAPAVPAHDQQHSVADVAQQLLDQAEKAETTVSSDLVSLVGEQGGTMAGFENRLKKIDRIAQKLEQKAHEKGITPQEYASKMADTLRYTAVIDSGNHATGVQGVLTALTDRGYQLDPLEVENNWANPIYHGININLQTPDGYTFELQFHTTESLDVKNRNHALFAQARQLTTSAAEKERLNLEMEQNIQGLAIPDRIFQVGTLVKTAGKIEVNPGFEPPPAPSSAEVDATQDRLIDEMPVLDGADASSSIGFYQSDRGFSAINDYLRGVPGRDPYGTGQLEYGGYNLQADEFLPEIDKLEAAIRQAPLAAPVTVYRHIGKDAVAELFGDADPPVGTIVSDQGFLSTSILPDVAETSDVYQGMVITVPAGTHGLYLNAYSFDHEEERELLLPRGSHLRILGVSNGLIYAEVTSG